LQARRAEGMGDEGDVAKSAVIVPRLSRRVCE
jgi:hypothetical protein